MVQTRAGAARQVGGLGRRAFGGASQAKLSDAYFSSPLAKDIYYLAWEGRKAHLFVPAVSRERIAGVVARCARARVRYVNPPESVPCAWDSYEVAFLERGSEVPLEVVCLSTVQTDWVPGRPADLGRIQLHVWAEASAPVRVYDVNLETL